MTTHRRSALKFFILVFALSAPLWLLQTFVKKSGLPLDIPITDIIAAFIPLLVACLLVAKEGGRSAVWELLKRVFDFRRIRRKRWLWAVVLIPVAIFVGIYIALRLSGAPLPEDWHIPFAAIPFLLAFFFLGAVGEEVGYMGYAFGPMQKRWGALGAALVMGVPWAVWHYPSILAQGHDFVWILWGTLGTVAMRVLLVWLYGNTNASLFACIAMHALYNTGRVIFPQDSVSSPLVDNPAIHYVTIAIIALLVVAAWYAKDPSIVRRKQVFTRSA